MAVRVHGSILDNEQMLQWRNIRSSMDRAAGLHIAFAAAAPFALVLALPAVAALTYAARMRRMLPLAVAFRSFNDPELERQLSLNVYKWLSQTHIVVLLNDPSVMKLIPQLKS